MTDDAAHVVRSHYEALGELYRAAWGDSLHFAVFKSEEDRQHALASMERMLVEEADMRSSDCVLDVGCGTGDVALAIARCSGAHVTGIDLVPRHVERARARAAEQGLRDRTAFLEADATEMHFPDASFDHVYAIESAYHAADKTRFYGECARVLRPGGCFLGTDWLCGDETSGGGHEQILARLRGYFAILELIDLPTLRRHLTAVGLILEVVEDLSRLGDIRRNWEALDPAAWPRLAQAARNAPPNALRTFAEGARMLSHASVSGAFILGHWRARKPRAAVPA
jgi:sterol 24-C-methyltransferase